MSDLFRSTSTWWAPSSKHAKRTAVGTTAIVLALGLITWSVWISPSSPVSTAVHHALGVKTSQEKAVDADALQTKLTAAQKQIWKLEGQLKSTSAQSGSRGDQLAQLKAQIASLQSQLGAAKASAAGKGSASTSTSTTTGGSSSSGGSGSGTHTASTGGAVTNPTTGPSKDPTTPVVVPTKQQIMSQPTRWYGLYTAQSPFNWAEYDQVSQQVGKATNMVGFFQGFDQDFNASAVQRAWANGRVPLMTWESAPAQTGNDEKYVAGYTNQDIISGKFDAYLTKYADALKANGQPMVIRLDHEMNGSWYNWSEGADQKNAAGSYVAMWQHVHDVFDKAGANDYVIWNWAPSRIDKLGNTKYQTLAYMQNYYPGADYVDWVGMSGYYRDATETPSYQNTFGATVDQLRQVAPGKKILLSEVGATETGTTASGGQKAKWITSLFDALAQPANDDIIGFSYFSETATTVVDGVRSTNDWRLNSRSDSLQAFVDGIKRTDTDYDLQEVTK